MTIVANGVFTVHTTTAHDLHLCEISFICPLLIFPNYPDKDFTGATTKRCFSDKIALCRAGNVGCRSGPREDDRCAVREWASRVREDGRRVSRVR
jgi:hypothetical protein